MLFGDTVAGLFRKGSRTRWSHVHQSTRPVKNAGSMKQRIRAGVVAVAG
jgi:hypothetical protein